MVNEGLKISLIHLILLLKYSYTQLLAQADVDEFIEPGPCPSFPALTKPLHWTKLKGLWFQQLGFLDADKAKLAACISNNHLGTGDPYFTSVASYATVRDGQVRVYTNGTLEGPLLHITAESLPLDLQNVDVQMIYTDYIAVSISYACREINEGERSFPSHVLSMFIHTRAQDPDIRVLDQAVQFLVKTFNFDPSKFTGISHTDCQY